MLESLLKTVIGFMVLTIALEVGYLSGGLEALPSYLGGVSLPGWTLLNK